MQSFRFTSFKPHWSWMILILLLAYALAIPHIQTHALWYDEIFTHIQSGTGLLQQTNMNILDTIISTALKDNAWPPLYYIVQNIWSRFAGHTLVSEHMLTLLAGLVGIALIYRFTKSLSGQANGLLSSLLLATSAFYVHYLHESRAYPFYIIFIVLVAWFYWMLLYRSNIKSRWLRQGFTVSITLALYTHYISGAFILGIATYHVLLRLIPDMKTNPVDNERWVSISKLWMNGCLLFVPWIAIMLAHLGFESLSERAVPIMILLRDTVVSFGNNVWFITIPLLIISIGMWQKPVVRFLWIWLLASAVVITIVNTFASFLFHPRHIMPVLIIFVILIANVILEIAKQSPRIALILVGIWVGAGIFYSSSLDFVSGLALYQRPLPVTILREMQDTTNQCVQENDYIIFSIDDTENDLFQTGVIQYYFQELANNYKMLGRFLTNDADMPDARSDIIRLSREEIISGYDNIWLMARPDIDNQAGISSFESVMSENDYIPCQVVSNENNARIIAYTQNEASCQMLLQTCP